MGFFDKAKDAAIQAAGAAQSELAARKEARDASTEGRFDKTRDFGQLSIDSNNELLKIKHATGEIKKHSGVMGKTAKATAALMTAGISLAAEAAMKPKDIVVPFDMIRGYTVIQDDEEIQGGTLGSAAVGGLLLGGVGAVIGAVGGKRKNKKAVSTLALRIDLNDLDMPCAVVTYLNKSTKTGSNEYKKAVSEMQNAMSCLDLIIANR